MISYGNNIRQPNNVLNKLPIDIVARKIQKPKPQLKNLIDQLRTIASIDPKKYRNLKVQLPYFVAANFKPSFRKIENFAFTEYFILDIDHLSDKNIEIDYLQNKLSKDDRVVLSFRSPSNDGLKVFMKLSEKCFDSGKYSLFYKAFAQKFSNEYNLNQVVDKKTSDVSRACFYSYDFNAHYNPNAIPVNINTIINFDNELEIREVERDIKQAERQNDEKPKESDNLKQEIPDSMLQQIRETLNPNIKTKREKKIFVPEELEFVLKDIEEALKANNIKVENIRNIHYGKQFKLSLKNIWAELNLFYGKKGYSVVKSTKAGSNEELTDVCHYIFCSVIYG